MTASKLVFAVQLFEKLEYEMLRIPKGRFIHQQERAENYKKKFEHIKSEHDRIWHSYSALCKRFQQVCDFKKEMQRVMDKCEAENIPNILQKIQMKKLIIELF